MSIGEVVSLIDHKIFHVADHPDRKRFLMVTVHYCKDFSRIEERLKPLNVEIEYITHIHIPPATPEAVCSGPYGYIIWMMIDCGSDARRTMLMFKTESILNEIQCDVRTLKLGEDPEFTMDCRLLKTDDKIW